MLDVYSTQGAKELGNFISTIRASTILIATFLLQTPTQAQISDYCEDVRGMVLEYCPHFAVHDLPFTELAAFLQVWMERRFTAEPAARRQLPSLLPLNDHGSMFQAMDFNRPTTDDVFVLMLKNLVIMFREHGMSFKYFFRISRGFKHAEFTGYNPAWPGLKYLNSLVGDGVMDYHPRPVGKTRQAQAVLQSRPTNPRRNNMLSMLGSRQPR
jgi:hypothetical protein